MREPLLQRVKSRLFIRSRRRATHLLDGQYSSIHRGRSLDLDDLRDYVPGDEVGDIDWKASARAQTTLVRRWTDERRHRVCFIVDSGRNMAAVSASGDTKREIAVVATGTLGYLSIKHGDEVGLITGDSSGVRQLPFGTSEGSLERLLRNINDGAELTGPESDTLGLLRRGRALLRHRSLVVVVTDEIRLNEELELNIVALSAKHELIWLEIQDAEAPLDETGRYRMVEVAGDWELPRALRGNRQLQQEFESQRRDRRERMQELLEHRGITVARLSSIDDVVPSLLRALKARHHARR